MPATRKDLEKSLKAITAEGATFPSLQPPPEVLDLVDEYIGTSAKSAHDAQRLSDVIVELTNGIIRLKTNRANNQPEDRVSAWLIILTKLCESGCVPKHDLPAALWTFLLRKVLIGGDHNEFVLSRDGLLSAKAILNWALMGKPDGPNNQLGALEDEILEDYLKLAAPFDPRTLGTSIDVGESRPKALLNLEDVLVTIGRGRPKAFFSHLSKLLSIRPDQRMALLGLLGAFLRSHGNLAHHILTTPLLDYLLYIVLLDRNTQSTEFSLFTINMIIARIPGSLEPYVPSLLVTFAQAVSITSITHFSAVNEVDVSPSVDESLSKSPLAEDVVLNGGKPLQLLDGSLWHPSMQEDTRGLALLPISELFTLLYGLYPCNLIAFLKGPQSYLAERLWQWPVVAGRQPPLNGRDLRDKVMPVFRNYTLHPSLLTLTPEIELTDKSRFVQPDSSATLADCERYIRPPPSPAVAAPQLAPTLDFTLDQLSAARTRSVSEQLSRADHYATLKISSGITPSPPSATSYSTSPPNHHTVSLDSHHQAKLTDPNIIARISHLEHENALLTAELGYELYLKQQHHQHMGVLHRLEVLQSSVDAERQTLYNQIRFFRAKVTAAEASLARERHEAATKKGMHNKRETDLTGKVKTLREEKRAWKEEGDKLKAQLEDAKRELESVAKLSEVNGNKLLDLETQAALDAPKLSIVTELQERIKRLTGFLLIWDDDLVKYKDQRRHVEAMLSEWQKGKFMQEAAELEFKGLSLRFESASNRVADLEQQLSSVQAQNKWDSSPTQSLRKENAGLRQELLHMRSQCNELQDRLMSRAAIEAELVRAAEQANVSHSDAQPSPVDSISDYNPPNLLNYVTSK